MRQRASARGGGGGGTRGAGFRRGNRPCGDGSAPAGRKDGSSSTGRFGRSVVPTTGVDGGKSGTAIPTTISALPTARHLRMGESTHIPQVQPSPGADAKRFSRQSSLTGANSGDEQAIRPAQSSAGVNTVSGRSLVRERGQLQSGGETGGRPASPAAVTAAGVGGTAASLTVGGGCQKQRPNLGEKIARPVALAAGTRSGIAHLASGQPAFCSSSSAGLRGDSRVLRTRPDMQTALHRPETPGRPIRPAQQGVGKLGVSATRLMTPEVGVMRNALPARPTTARGGQTPAPLAQLQQRQRRPQVKRVSY